MKRRTFLHVGSTAATLAGTSCSLGKGLMPESALSASEMSAYLGRVDGALATINSGSVLGQFIDAPRAREGGAKTVAAGEALARKSLRTLVLTGMYNDLPPASRKHPSVVKRMQTHAAEFDEAVGGSVGLLGSMSEAQRQGLQLCLRDDPGLAMRICESLDRPAKAAGVSLKRRMQMRSIVAHVNWRLSHQSPSLLIDEYVNKAVKVAARHGQQEELRRQAAAVAFDETLWRIDDQLAAGATGSATSAAAPRQSAQSASSGSSSAGSTAFTTAGVLAGTGALLMGVGGAVVGGGEIAGAFVMTAGAVLLLGALIALIVGAIQRASAK